LSAVDLFAIGDVEDGHGFLGVVDLVDDAAAADADSVRLARLGCFEPIGRG
jgi:hypothetical protein